MRHALAPPIVGTCGNGRLIHQRAHTKLNGACLSGSFFCHGPCLVNGMQVIVFVIHFCLFLINFFIFIYLFFHFYLSILSYLPIYHFWGKRACVWRFVCTKTDCLLSSGKISYSTLFSTALWVSWFATTRVIAQCAPLPRTPTWTVTLHVRLP